MHFYRNSKERRSYLILHKHEWHRLKRHTEPPAEVSNEQTEYVKSLIEQSQAWTRTWPDTEVGCFKQYKKKHQMQREADIAMVQAVKEKNAFKKSKQSEKAIKEAKEKIFERSCYGKKLISALNESKVLEERDEQIKFLKQLREKEEGIKQTKIEPSCTFGLDKQGSQDEQDRKNMAILTAEQNKEMFDKQKTLITVAKEAQKLADLENAQVTKQMLDLEKVAEKKCKLLEKESLKEYLADCKNYKDEHAKREAEYNTEIKMCQKKKEEINSKITDTLNKIYNRTEMPWFNKVYENTKERNEEKLKRADAFEEKIIKAGVYGDKEEQRLKELLKTSLANRLSIAKLNKQLAEIEKQKRCTSVNKCFCDRQTPFLNNHKQRTEKQIADVQTDDEKSTVCFGQTHKLTAELKKRMKEPPPWTGVKSAHDQFARYADETLRECKYKLPGRRAVDEYKQNNGVDILDVPNYY